MASMQELQIQQKREVEKREEATVPSRVFLPTTDIYETQDALERRDGDAGCGKKQGDYPLDAGTLAIRANNRAANGYKHSAISRSVANFPFMFN
jgi:hypothetical protein